MATITADDTDGVVYLDQNDMTPGGSTTQVNDGWGACRNSSTGSLVYNSIIYSTAGTLVKKWDADRFMIRRSFFAFDTSGVTCPDDGATAAILKIYGRTYGTADLIAVKATAPDLSTGVATGDFNALDGWNSNFSTNDLTAYSSEVSTWNTSGYNEFTLNKVARDDMASSSVFKIAIIEYDYDYLGVEYNPGTTGDVSSGMYYNHANSLADGKRPYIDYTVGACGYGHDVDGVSATSIGEIIGVAAADIANRSGVNT